MKTYLMNFNIKKRILFITEFFTFGMGIIILASSFYLYQEFLRDGLMKSAQTNQQFIADSINNNVDEVFQLARWCQINTRIGNYIKASDNTSYAVAAHERLSEEFQSNGMQKYIHRAVVSDHVNFIQVVTSTSSSTVDIAAVAPKLSYFSRLLESSDGCELQITTDPFYLKREIKVITIVRPITYQFNSTAGGWVLIQFSPRLLKNALAKYTNAEKNAVYLTMPDVSYEYTKDGFVPIDTEYKIIRDLSDRLDNDKAKALRIQTADKKTCTIVTTPLKLKGCYISQVIPDDHGRYLGSAIFVMAVCLVFAVLLLALVLTLIINRAITHPVNKIENRIRKIAEGDFSRDSSIEWTHELGIIGRGINDLAENVLLLMNKRLDDEKQKRDLEYQMLLNQINPHFLYNTLNSIKWMATIQNASGIAEMTTSLSRLLKSVSKGTRLLIGLREELALVSDYYTIQQYRYGGALTLNTEVAEESLYDCQIIKFTLQPLVENAIFHGIEPKGKAGNIQIHIFLAAPDIVQIDVTDDGVGMTRETIDSLLSDTPNGSTEFFKGIGISNVHKRLQYEFGEGYGISIDSRLNEYTTMSIRIPYRKE